MNQEEMMLSRRFIDLANAAYQRNVPMFSDYLNLNEQSVFEQTLRDMPPVICRLTGGYPLAERKIAAFLPYEVEEDDLPITALIVRPVNRKFAQELCHRDFLGALLNLGIDRCIIGDILVNESAACVFCKEKMAGYVMKQLTRVKNTVVMAKEGVFSEDFVQRTQPVTGTVRSVRLDSVLSVATGISRSHIIDHIEGAKVFVNGKLITTNSYALKDGDILSVRHVGRFLYKGVSAQSKKGRYFVTLEKFM